MIAMSPKAARKQDKHKLASVLAQINLASCFCNKEEPLFAVLSPLIYEHLAVGETVELAGSSQEF